MIFNRNSYQRTGFKSGLAPAHGWRELNNLLQSMRHGSGVFPPFRLTEEKDRFILQARMPGVTPEDLKVTLQGKTLYLEGERKFPETAASSRFHRQERQFDAFSRAITLPVEIDAAKVEAKQTDGILYMVLPKDQAQMPREIKVN